MHNVTRLIIKKLKDLKFQELAEKYEVIAGRIHEGRGKVKSSGGQVENEN